MDVGPFDCEFLPVTHSIPSGNITAFHTEQGVILHSSDFKLDLTPVDGRRTDLSRIGALANDPGIRLMLADSTNADAPGASRSETEVGRTLASLIRAQEGRRVIVASFASHIHRLQQLANAAVDNDRVLVTLGLSMRRNVKLARDVGILRIPDWACATSSRSTNSTPSGPGDRVHRFAGGTPSSAHSDVDRAEQVAQARRQRHRDLLQPSDSGQRGCGGGGAQRPRSSRGAGLSLRHRGRPHVGPWQATGTPTLHSVAVPEWFVPVHGEYAHLVAHRDLAHNMGMPADRVVFCEDGDQIRLTDDGIEHSVRSAAITSMSTAWSVISATPCCRTTHPRRRRLRRRCRTRRHGARRDPGRS